jgi:hypothetical protein
VEPGIVRACLANGCPEAAEHMVRRGASLDLEEAAGVGRADAVQRQLDAKPPLVKEAAAALLMACWYGRREVAELLLDRGVDVAVRADGDGDTALHIAAYQGHVDLVELLLRRGAPLDVRDEKYGTTPLVWALHAWLAENRTPDEPYRAVVRMLAEAGAGVQADWIDDDRVRGDPELRRLLGAERRARREP